MQSFSQEKAKWKKVKKAEKELIKTELDTSAVAVVLSDVGNFNFMNNPITVQRHVRIKILKKSGLNYANIKIPYYKGDNIESISAIKAQTLNTLPNGKIEKIKVASKNIFDKKKDDVYNEIAFTFPDVKIGSIIEYKYKFSTKSFELPKWIFQVEIPTLYSECNVKIGNSLKVDIFYQGNRLISKYSGVTTNKWVLTNLRPLKKEEFCPNTMDYAEILNFQIAGYYKQSVTYALDKSLEYETFGSSWKDILKDILANDRFNSYLNRTSKAQKLLTKIIGNSTNKRKNFKKIYDYVAQNYQWNGFIGTYPDDFWGAFLTSKQGNAASKNMLLALLLKQAGFETEIYLISTKAHGKVSINCPLISQLNHIVIKSKLYDETYYLDCKNSLYPYNLAPVENLVKNALLLDKTKEKWIDISQKEESQRSIFSIWEIKDKKMVSTTRETLSNYEALNKRIELIEKDNAEEYLKLEIEKQSSEIKLDSLKVFNIKDIDKNLKIYISSSKNFDLKTTSNIYINTWMSLSEKNPFLYPERFLPIDLYYPFEKKYTAVIKIPEDYEVDELPEQKIIKLPAKDGEVSFKYWKSEKEIKIELDFKINKTLYQPNEYEYLQKIYSFFIEKLNTVVVLKKKH